MRQLHHKGKRIGAFLFALVFVVTSVFTGMVPAMAIDVEPAEIPVAEIPTEAPAEQAPAAETEGPTELTFEFPEGDYTVEDGVYTLNKKDWNPTDGGNNTLPSTTAYADSFEYSADVKLIEGNAATLVFGYDMETNRFHGLDMRQIGDQVRLASFVNNDPTLTNGNMAFQDIMVPNTNMTTDFINVRMVMTKEHVLTIYINDKQAHVHDFGSGIPYQPGNLGLLTWQAQAQFKNLKGTANIDTPEDESNFNTNLGDLDYLSGSWVKTEDGLVATGSGDNFAMSKIQAENFIFEATITDNNPDLWEHAASLVFRVQDPEKPADGSYVFNIWQNVGSRLFRFPGGTDITARYPMGDPAPTTCHIKVVAIGNKINCYIDDVLVHAGTDDEYSGGYLGLLNFNGNFTFQDVYYTPIEDDTTPALTGLEIDGEDLVLSPEFDPSIVNYNLYAGRNNETITVTPTAEEGTSLTISAVGPDGVVLEEKAIASGEGQEISLPVGDTTITIMATKGDVSMGTVIKANRKSDGTYMAAEPYRPQFHYTAENGCLDDPNGLVYDPSNGTWHMYYQFNLVYPGFYNWGHAQSTDLVHWQEMPIAIAPDELGTIFSGSAVVDDKNTSGFFTDNKPGESKLVAFYTYHAGPVGQVIATAYSKDHGVTWNKYDGNPVIDESHRIYGADFRDPKVWWQEDPEEPAGGIWLMVVAGGRGRLFSSHDLKTWKDEQAFVHDAGSGNDIWSECPTMFPMTVEGTDEEKWVYVGASDVFAVGDLKKTEDGWRFVNVTDFIQTGAGGASSLYAGQHYFNDGAGKDRKIMVHWIQEWNPFGNYGPDGKRWNAIQSIPRETGLKIIDDQYHLTAYPVEEIDANRGDVIFSTENTVVDENTPNILADTTGQYYDVEATFTPGTAKEFGFKLRTGNGQETVVKYNTETDKLLLDFSQSGPAARSNLEWTLHPMENGKVQLRILVDTSVIEVFGNYGDADIADAYYPDPDSIGMEFFTVGGDVAIDEMNIWQMKSMYTEDGESGTEPMFLSLKAPEIAEPGEEFTVQSTILPLSATDKSVTWEIPEGLTVVEEADTYVVLKSDIEGDYTIKATSNTGALEEEITVKVAKKVFNTNLTNLKLANGVGSWVKGPEGMEGRNEGVGDSYYLSENILPNVPFTYEADVKNTSGQYASLVFGIQDLDNPAATWYCFNLSKDLGHGRIFKNVAGQGEVITQPYQLTEEQRNQESFHMKVVYDDLDNDGTFEFVAYLDDVEVARMQDPDYNGGYIGLLTYRANATFNNVYLTLEDEIVAVSPMDDINVQLGSDVTIEDIEATLPAQVTVEMESGAKILANVTAWDTSKVDLTQAGTYEITGTVEGTDIPAIIKVVVQAEKFIESLTPEEINVSAVEGSTAEEVWNMIDKDVVANYSDGTTANLVVSDWDYSNVNFDEPGNYVATGTLTLNGEAIEMTIPINVTITAEGGQENPGTDKPSIPGSDEDQVGGGDWDWPSGSGSDSTTGSGSGDKENPSSGDHSMIAGALAVLALSAGAAVVLSRKRK